MPSYRPEMIDIARQVLREGGTIAMVAAACGVSKSAVQRWKRVSSSQFKVEFAEMWEVESAQFEAYHDKIYLREFDKPTRDFNAVLVSMFRRNNSEWTEHRKLDFPTLANPNLTFAEQREELMRLLAGNQLTAHEVNYLAKAIADFAQLDQLEKLRIEVEELKALMKKGNSNHGEINSDCESGA